MSEAQPEQPSPEGAPVYLPDNLTVEDLTRMWADEYRDLWEEQKIPMSLEELERDKEVILNQLEGCREQKDEVGRELARLREGHPDGGFEEENELLEELEDITTNQIPGLEEMLEHLEEGGELFNIQHRIFRRYTKEEGASEARILQELVRRGFAENYDAAERLVAERHIEILLQQGRGWEAIRIGVESKFIGDDVVMDALDSVEQFMEQAREAGNATEYERLKKELEHIENWRGLS